jgi:L-asparaginase
MTTESAIAKLMYLLGVGVEKDNFAHYFEHSLRGEITNK